VTRDILEKAIGCLQADKFYFKRVSDRWITGETFVEAIKAAKLIHPTLTLNETVLNTILSRHATWKTQYQHYDNTNTCGIHQAKFGKNPGTFWYLRSEGKRYALTQSAYAMMRYASIRSAYASMRCAYASTQCAFRGRAGLRDRLFFPIVLCWQFGLRFRVLGKTGGNS